MLIHPYYGWLGILLKIFTKVKLVINSHNIESLRFKSMNKSWWKPLWYYEKYIHRNANLNFFITDEDKNYAIEYFGLNKDKCFTITYGFDFNTPPNSIEKNNAKNELIKIHSISNEDVILLFNGTLDYKPNLDAVNHIINSINPVLLQHNNFNYKIIICGKGLPLEYNNLKDQPNVIYAGFVDDISLYFKGADIFINPVIDGGGIKTKLVEALGNNLYSISTVEGAIGVPENITNNKLKIIRDTNWETFAKAIIEADFQKDNINGKFFEYFYWENIAEKAKNAIELNS